MRSEAEIRRQVETRLHRWGMLALNAILWIGAAKLIDAYIQYASFYGGARDGIVLVMVLWLSLIGLHALWVFYREIREGLVRWAIAREHQVYGWQPMDEKPKRRESASLPDESRLSLPVDDGEYPGVPSRHEPDTGTLVDFPFRYEPDQKAKR